MSLRRRWTSWMGMSWEMRFILIECASALTLARLMVAFGLRWFARSMLRREDAGAKASPEVQRQVRAAIRMASGVVPWKSLCLPEAMAARLMLRRRGCGSIFHLGAGVESSGKLHAHAWLECDGMIVAGEAGVQGVVAFGEAKE